MTLPRCTQVEDSALKTYVGRVVRNDELYPNSRERSARHVEMEVPQEFRYEAGDHIGVLPHNHPELVYQFAASVMGPQYQSQRQLDWLLHAPASDHGGDLVPMWDPSHGALSGMTLRELLTTVVDLSGPATRSMIQTMAECAEDAAEASALADLASVSSGSQYDALVLKRRRRLVDMLEAYPSVKLPLTTALELLPRLEPRYYSISSAPEKHNNKVHLTVTVHRQPIEHQALLFEGPWASPVKGACAACSPRDPLDAQDAAPATSRECPRSRPPPWFVCATDLPTSGRTASTLRTASSWSEQAPASRRSAATSIG